VNQISHHSQQWTTQEAQSFGIVSAVTELIKPLPNCPRLSEVQQIDFIEKIDTLGLPPNDIHFFGGGSVHFSQNHEYPVRVGKR
jgi:citrate lyase alpha subunit